MTPPSVVGDILEPASAVTRRGRFRFRQLMHFTSRQPESRFAVASHFRSVAGAQGEPWVDQLAGAIETDRFPEDRLDTYHVMYRRLGEIASTPAAAAAVFGVSPLVFRKRRKVGALAQRLREFSRSVGRCVRRKAMIRRLLHASREYRGWACVMVTLTVAPGHEDAVFRRGSRAWVDFTRRLARRAPKRFVYAATVERGRFGRPHIHALLWFEVLPPEYSTDPARSGRRELRVPDRGQVWPHGFSSWLPVRSGRGDYYGLRGWFWPRDLDGQAQQELHPECAIGYITKYMTKSAHMGDLQWRIRLTRNLGLRQWIRAFRLRPEAARATLRSPYHAQLRIPPEYRPTRHQLLRAASRALKSLNWRPPIAWRMSWAIPCPRAQDVPLSPQLIARTRRLCMKLNSGRCPSLAAHFDVDRWLQSRVERLARIAHPIDEVWASVAGSLAGVSP